MPDSVFHSLNEFTGGGYIMFIIDGDGVPRVYSECDNVTMSLGLLTFSRDYLDTIDDIQRRSNRSAIMGNPEEEDEM